MAMDDKYLFYESQAARGNDEHESLLEGNVTWIWNDRLLLIGHNNEDESESDDESESNNEYATNSEHKKSDSEFWHFKALDLITNETRPVHFPKSDSKFRQVKIVSLNKEYGFVVESAGDSFCVNLVKLNWAPGEFQLIERIDQPYRFDGILVSNLDPTKFVLKQLNGGRFIYQTCTLDSGKVEFGDDVYESFAFFEHYFNNKLCGMDDQFEVETYDWVTKKEDSVEINTLPNGRIDGYRIGGVKNCLYTATRFDDANGIEKSGIAYTNLETKRWISTDFAIDMRISRIQYFDGSLIVYANNADGDGFDSATEDSTYSNDFKVYSIPVNRPQSLRKMAWPLVVQTFKRNESIDDPYKAAARFLPFNSDLRPPWYKDETALENLEVLDESESNEQNQYQSNEQGKTGGDASIQNDVNSTEETAGKASESKSSQESSDAVPSKRSKFN